MTILAWTIGTCWIPYQLIMDIRKFISVDIKGSAPLVDKGLSMVEAGIWQAAPFI